MCGRTAQSFHAVRAAAADLQIPSLDSNLRKQDEQQNSRNLDVPHSQNTELEAVGDASSEVGDNYNVCPGMDVIVFWKGEDKVIKMGRKKWGIVPQGGTSRSPLPEGMNIHFQKRMFNARTDNFLESPLSTYAKLASKGNSCLIAMDGFYEWKLEMKEKQPYFVYRKKRMQQQSLEETDHGAYLLFAGVWTSVATGREDNATLDSFTIFTSNACPALEWLHDRMPVTVWDREIALRWLEQPSKIVLRDIERESHHYAETMLQWHAVTRKMSSLKYRTADAMAPIPTTKSVKEYFTIKKSEVCGSSTSVATPSKEIDKRSSSLTDILVQKRAKRESFDKISKSHNKKRRVATPQKVRPIDSFFKSKEKS